MASFKIGVLVLCSVVVVCLSQVSQGGPHESQGEPHVTQGGAHVTQGGSRVTQGDPHVPQGGPHVPQGGPHVPQGGSHVSQETKGRVRRQVPQAVDWVTCDFTSSLKISCHNCNTRVICKPIGGILKPCSPQKPFCNNGGCSTVPSSECA